MIYFKDRAIFENDDVSQEDNTMSYTDRIKILQTLTDAEPNCDSILAYSINIYNNMNNNEQTNDTTDDQVETQDETANNEVLDNGATAVVTSAKQAHENNIISKT